MWEIINNKKAKQRVAAAIHAISMPETCNFMSPQGEVFENGPVVWIDPKHRKLIERTQTATFQWWALADLYSLVFLECKFHKPAVTFDLAFLLTANTHVIVRIVEIEIFAISFDQDNPFSNLIFYEVPGKNLKILLDEMRNKYRSSHTQY